MIQKADFGSAMRAKGFAQDARGEWVKVSSGPLAPPTSLSTDRDFVGQEKPDATAIIAINHLKCAGSFAPAAIQF
jgi:hypothetical protein